MKKNASRRSFLNYAPAGLTTYIFSGSTWAAGPLPSERPNEIGRIVVTKVQNGLDYRAYRPDGSPFFSGQFHDSDPDSHWLCILKLFCEDAEFVDATKPSNRDGP